MVLYGAIEAYLREFDHHLRFIVRTQGLSLKNTALAILPGGLTSYRNSFVVIPLQNTRNQVVYHFEIKLTISSIVQTWSLTPAAIAGVLGYGLANVLCGRAKL